MFGGTLVCGASYLDCNAYGSFFGRPYKVYRVYRVDRVHWVLGFRVSVF